VERAKSAPLDPVGELTTREREVFWLAAEGQSSADIAARLGISPRTAETHRANLMRKLGLHNQTDLVRFAIRQGILPPE
jgi:DNA-binding CsgD family transcriptional regulator